MVERFRKATSEAALFGGLKILQAAWEVQAA